MYALGEDFPKDEREALRWLRSAAARGHGKAIGIVQWFPRQSGGPFLVDLVDPADVVEVRRHIDMRARMNWILRGLRHCPKLEGQEVIQGIHSLLLELTEFEDDWALVGWAWRSEFGVGMPVDLRVAFENYQSAADQLNPAGQAGLARLAKKTSGR